MSMKDMHLHFLGTAGYHPNETRHTSCLFVPECGLMLDAGTGFFRAIELSQTPTLDILLSHAHLDHVFGLTVVLDLIYRGPVRTIRVYGEANKLKAIREHLFSEFLFPVVPRLHWIDLESLGEEFVVCGAKVRWFPLEHPGGSVGYRLDWPTVSVAYVTDTTCRADSDYWRHLHGIDHLIHECNFRDNESEFAELTGHSHFSPVLEQASRHGAKNLILTHLNPLADNPSVIQGQTSGASSTSNEKYTIASDGMVLRLV